MERFEFDPAAHDPSETSRFVESGCGAVTVGSGCLLPPLSSGGAQVPSPSLRFHALLIEPDVRISRIRLSDRTSRSRMQRRPQCLTTSRSLIGCPISASLPRLALVLN